ncbi:MAG: hypothetical protein NC089_13000 [Bacteroides sp.]|nr:hypothetical protein [Bacteroides sp.]
MKKRLWLICIGVLAAMLLIGCIIWIWQKENTSTIPNLREVALMSDAEATSCLAGHTRGELCDTWGYPTVSLSGMPGDYWILSGSLGKNERGVTVYYTFDYYGDMDGGIDDWPISFVITPNADGAEVSEGEMQTEEAPTTEQQEEGRTERDTSIYSMRDVSIQEILLYASFLDNKVTAIDGDSQKERHWSDYYDTYVDSSTRAVHMKLEDVNGDGEKELLLHLRQRDSSGRLFVFHNENGSLVEWESIPYDMDSPVINLYNNQILEITGLEDKGFFRYNDEGKLEPVFDYDSKEKAQADGASGGVYEDSIPKLPDAGRQLNALFLVGTGEYTDYDDILDGVRDEGTYGYYDVDGDGIDELVIYTVPGTVKIYAARENEISKICWVPYSILLEDGTIWFHRPGGAPLHDDYQWYRLEGEEYQEMYTFSRYDGDGYEENGEGDLYLYNHEEIEKEKWEEWIQPFLDSEKAVLLNEGTIRREE